MAYNPTDHPRAPKGTPQGGQFTQKAGVGVDDDIDFNANTSILDFQPASDLRTSIRATSYEGVTDVRLPEDEPTDDDRIAWEDFKQWVQEHNIETSIDGFAHMSLEDATQLAHAQNTMLRNHIADQFDTFAEQHRFWRGGKQALQTLKQTTLKNTCSRQTRSLQLQFAPAQREILDNVQRNLDAFAEREQVRPLRTNPAVVRMIEEHPELAPYVNPQKHDTSQAGQILMGLETGVDISQYNDPDRYDNMQMNAVYWGLREKVDVSQFNDPERYTAEQMHYVEIGLRDGLDVSKYNNPERFSAEAMARAYWRQRNARDQHITPLRGQHFGRR